MSEIKIDASLKHLGKQIKDHREEAGNSLYYNSVLCEMGSPSGLRRIEAGEDIRLRTLLKVSKNLGIDFTIKGGVVTLQKKI